jgi:hypothetical protein
MWKFSDLQFKTWEAKYLGNLVTLYPYKEASKIRKLSRDEESIFKKFIKYLFWKACRGQAELLFRGDSKNNLKLNLFSQEHLGSEYSRKYLEIEFYNRLFLIGKKAKIYKREHEEIANLIPNKSSMLLLSINNIEDDAFEYIFRVFFHVFSENFNRQLVIQIEQILNEFKYLGSISNSHQGVLRGLAEKARELEIIESFKSTEKTFCEYFQRLESKNFLTQLPSVKNARLKIRDYYLYLIHNFSSSKFSILCSTSRDIGIAEEFSKGYENKDGIIFFYFSPNLRDIHAMSLELGSNGCNLCKHYSLPVYGTNFYPREDEVALKGGLIPHRILGIFDMSQNKFVVNPHLFLHRNSDKISLDILKDGYNIDQENFPKLIKDTGYRGYFFRYDEFFVDSFLL